MPEPSAALNPNPLMTLTPGGRRDQWSPPARPGYVLLDVDGTLMGPSKVVTPEVVTAVHDVVAAGVPVGFATGRPVSGVTQAQQQLQLAGPHIVLNGAQIRHNGTAVSTWPLTDAHRKSILQLCADHDLYAELYTDDAILVTSFDERFRPHWDEVIGQPFGTVADHPALVDQTIKATIVTLNEGQQAAVERAIGELGLTAGAATSPVTPGLTYINITQPGADKGSAVTAIARSMGLNLKEVVVVGDGANDLPLLTVAGTAIAMADAPALLTDVAHHIVPGVKDDGAAVALSAVLQWVQSV